MGFFRIVVIALGIESAALAQAGDPAAATELFKQGREAMQRGDAAAACPKFAESLRLDPKVGTYLNLAECEEKLGKLASARANFQRAIDLGRAQNDDRVPLAEERLAALDKRVPRLAIALAKTAPADAIVRRDDVQLGAASLGTPLPVNPGQHVIVVSAAGHADRTFDFSIGEGESSKIDVDVGEAVRAPPQSQPQPLPVTADVPPPKSSGSSVRVAGFITAGAGLAALGGGAIAGLIAIQTNSDSMKYCKPDPKFCDSPGVDLRNQALTAGDVASVLFIGGAILAAAGVTMMIVAPKNKQAARLDLTPLGGVRATW